MAFTVMPSQRGKPLSGYLPAKGVVGRGRLASFFSVRFGNLQSILASPKGLGACSPRPFLTFARVISHCLCFGRLCARDMSLSVSRACAVVAPCFCACFCCCFRGCFCCCYRCCFSLWGHGQVAFMRGNPLVSVLGSAVAVFSGECVRQPGGANVVDSPSVFSEQRGGDSDHHHHLHHDQQQQQQTPPPLSPPPPVLPRRRQTDVFIPASRVQRVVAHPTAPGFLAWSLLFSCCLAHPSVMLRRDRVIEAGGYDPTAEPSEDYDLWLRMETSAPGCLANTGEVRCSVFALASRWRGWSITRQRSFLSGRF